MIPVSRPAIDRSDIEYVKRVMRDTFVTGGPQIAEFEEKIAGYCGRKYAVTVTNATSALAIAVRALKLTPKSKILVPSFTIVSLIHAIIINGNKPVIIDLDPNTWNESLKQLREAIKKDIKAAIIPQTYSSAPPMLEISELLKRSGVMLIEDAAEGFGGSYNGKKFGSFGDISILSFYANKLITTGEGGMILTDDKKIHDQCLSFRNLCFDKDRRFIHSDLSGNYRMTNLQAALGLAQFKRINMFYRHREKLYQMYIKLLSPFYGKQIAFQQIPKVIESSYWVFPILLLDEKHTADQIISQLNEKGVEARHFFYPLERQPFIKEKYIPCPVSLNLWKYGIYLPLGNGIAENEVERSSQALLDILSK